MSLDFYNMRTVKKLSSTKVARKAASTYAWLKESNFVLSVGVNVLESGFKVVGRVSQPALESGFSQGLLQGNLLFSFKRNMAVVSFIIQLTRMIV